MKSFSPLARAYRAKYVHPVFDREPIQENEFEHERDEAWLIALCGVAVLWFFAIGIFLGWAARLLFQ